MKLTKTNQKNWKRTNRLAEMAKKRQIRLCYTIELNATVTKLHEAFYLVEFPENDFHHTLYT